MIDRSLFLHLDMMMLVYCTFMILYVSGSSVIQVSFSVIEDSSGGLEPGHLDRSSSEKLYNFNAFHS